MKKFFDSTVVQVILILIIAAIVNAFGQILGLPLVWVTSLTGNEAIAFMGLYAQCIGIWIAVFILWGIVKKYRCLFSILGPKPKGNKIGKSLLLGLIFGLGTNLLTACIALLCGDIRLTFNEINIGYIVGFLIAVCIQSGAEEILMRGYVHQNLRRLFPGYPIVAIVGNALLFMLFHINSTGVTALGLLNLLISGIMMSMIVYYFDSFWGAVLVHTGWNFCQSIILGLPNSGRISEYSIFTLDTASARSSFAYNVNFGLEGTVTSIIILALACVIIFIVGRKRNQEPFNPWETNEINNEQKETEE